MTVEAWAGGLMSAVFLGVATAGATPVLSALAPARQLRGAGAYGLSADGTTVVGLSFDGPSETATVWTSGGAAALSSPGGGSRAYAVSADGARVAGSTGGASVPRPVIWEQDGTRTSLAIPDGAVFADVFGLSGSGRVAVGQGLAPSRNIAVRWTDAGVERLIDSPSIALSLAKGVSYSGDVVCGFYMEPGTGAFRAFVWTAGLGWEDLGGSPASSIAQAVSGDGRFVVGSQSAGAYRWTRETGYELLGGVAGWVVSPWAVNFDGSIVGGQMTTGSVTRRGFIWTREGGVQEIGSYLASLGVDTAGWEFTSVSAISPDGSSLAGSGRFRGVAMGWSARNVPGPGGLAMLATIGLAGARRRARGARS